MSATSISLHFKELNETDPSEQIERETGISNPSTNDQLTVIEQNKTSANVDAQVSNSIEDSSADLTWESSDTVSNHPDVDPLMEVPVVDVSVKKRNSSTDVPSSSHIHKRVLSDATASNSSFSPQRDLFSDFHEDTCIDAKTKDEVSMYTNPLPAENILKSSNKSFSIETVDDHPLAHLSNSIADDDDDDFDMYSPRSAESKPARPAVKHHFSEKNVPWIEASTTKGMISSALFNSKARTKLFSTIKKNIQQYTGSGSNAPGDIDQAKTFQYARLTGSDFALDEDVKDETESQTSDIFSHLTFHSDSSIIKGIKGKVVEPLQAMKRAWEEGTPKETQQKINVQSSPEVRKRSTSEYDYNDKLSAPTSRNNSSNGKPPEEKSRTSSISMSFSSLLAERQKSREDTHSRGSSGSEYIESGTGFQRACADRDSPQYKRSEEEDDVKRRDKHKPLPFLSSPIQMSMMYILFLCAYFYLVLPLPMLVYVAANFFVFGVIFSSIMMCIFTSPKKQPVEIKMPYINLSVPHYVPTSVYDPAQPYKGWMNEIDSYDISTYHVNSTRSVFITLEGTTLRLQTPRRNIPRRAMFGEGNMLLSNVIHQRLYNITSARVYLMPPDLVKKRVWSKKYPICIEFSPSKAADKPLVNENSKEKDLAKHDMYDIIEEDELTEKLYLFGRTQRQKEEWFYRFQRAIALAQLEEKNKSADSKLAVGEATTGCESPAMNQSDSKWNTYQRESSESTEEIPRAYGDQSVFNPIATYRDYYTYMCRLLPDPAVYTVVKSGSANQDMNKENMNVDDPRAVLFSTMSDEYPGMAEVVMSQPRQTLRSPQPDEPGLEIAWFNVVIGRIMFDFLRRPKWASWVSNKIQKKLEKIRLPYFMEGLKLTGMDLGTTVPLVHRISLPKLDSQGVWLEMEVTYNGAVQMTLETKMVLTKLGKQHPVLSVDKKKLQSNSAITNSDEEDSAESSDEDESTVSRLVSQVQTAVSNVSTPDSTLSTSLQYLASSNNNNLPPSKVKDKSRASNAQQSNTTSTPQPEKRWVRIVDSITKSKYFQRATENSYIRKKLETVSNTPLILTAELHQCQGTLCVNVPPPPSDRIWYGFKDHPHMVLRARPKLGERAVTVTPVTDWIEKKLLQEFNKILLMPNMDDIPVPLMFNNLTKAA